MAVVYLEPEDEITGAVARLRALPGGNVVIVLPAGSRIATSRINFRLLAREAGQRQLRLATVSDEPSVRAISVAAGVSAYESVDAAESALAQEAHDSPLSASEAATAVLPVVPATTEETSLSAEAAPLSGDEAPAPPTDGVRPPRFGGRLSVEPPLYDVGDVADVAQRRRRRRGPAVVAPIAAVVLLLILAGLGLYAAYLFVPTATVTLRPKLIDVGPLSITVSADPRVAVVDVAAGLIPAEEIEIPIEARGTFSATGSSVTMTAATGRVRFSSKNTFVEVPVPTRTVVSTSGGVDFETTEAVTVPRANFNTQTPGTVIADVVARERGTKGNVGAGSIKELPTSLVAALVSVRNPQPTSGGSREEQSVVTQDDYDAALTQLTTQLEPALAAALADPATTPHGLTLYPLTARLGIATPDQQPADVVDAVAATFELSVAASATVLAVNEELIDDVAQSQLRGLVPSGTTLLPATINTTHAPGDVFGNVVRFNASGVANSWRAPDAEAVIAEVSGQSVGDARTIMETYGSVEISIWPDFIDRLPDQNRIRLTIIPPQETP